MRPLLIFFFLQASHLVFATGTHSFEFHIAQQQVQISPGVSRLKTVVNGQFPGPLIRVPYKSRLKISVYNDIGTSATTIHWHGMHQRGTPYSDGVATQSQCPVQPGTAMVYNFDADPSGTAFWHAHFHSESVDGLYGPIIVEDDLVGRFPFVFDEERVILMTDCYDQSSWSLEQFLLSPPPANESPHADPSPNQGLICLYDESKPIPSSSCSTTASGSGFNLNFDPGKTYRLRLIGAAELAPFLFSIDEHELQLIAVDYAIVDRITWLTSLPIVTGQRYDVLVRARENVTDGQAFWVRATMQPQCWPYTGGLESDVRGILTYGEGPHTNTPSSTSWNATNPECADLDYSVVKPVKSLPLADNAPPAMTLFLNITFPVLVNGVLKALVNGNDYQVDDSAYPTLFSVNQDPNWRPAKQEERNLLTIPDNMRGKEVRLLIRNLGIPGAHPYHSHGRGFKIVAYGAGNFTQGDLDRVNKINVRDVVERDTAVVPSLGWLMTQFTADNPGVWPIHCHVGWHLMSGMLGQIVELPKAITAEIVIPDKLKDMCSNP